MAGSTGALYAINPNMAQQFSTETKKKNQTNNKKRNTKLSCMCTYVLVLFL
jgi:hypothetical protein